MASRAENYLIYCTNEEEKRIDSQNTTREEKRKANFYLGLFKSQLEDVKKDK